MSLYLSYDIGSISVNRTLLKNGRILDVLPYTRHRGEPLRVVATDLADLSDLGDQEINGLGFTGSGAKQVAAALEAVFVNEIEALVIGIKHLYPKAKTAIEIGGEDSKFIDLLNNDYAMNELCAAGTGSFLDQQAFRFNLSIEEFSRLALQSKSPATIAGRCSVFAKSDMMHLQQEATPDQDIALGLCYAMARSFKSGIARGRSFTPPIVFCGGVAFNEAMVRAFQDICGQEVIIPAHRESVGALGAALSLPERNLRKPAKLTDIAARLDNYRKHFTYQAESLPPLQVVTSRVPDTAEPLYAFQEGKVDASLGIDVGSVSTNVVAIDSNRKIIYKVYLRTAGRPIEAVRKGIEMIGKSVGDRLNVKAVGTTGSGRYLIGDIVGADVVINEITAQATAAADIDKSVDTIFEIGGQDSKYISLENGVVVDFEMNKICAAGTGSFLEEQAERFNIRIEDFGALALKALNPLNLGERCTVFMETNVYAHYQKGASIENILAGLAYSIAINYINKVVCRKRIGNRVFFQGAVAFNKAVVAAFEQHLGRAITVPDHHEMTGAIGTAIVALRNAPTRSRFRGFKEIYHVKYSQNSFECHGCPNDCDIKKVSVENSPPLFYGGRCEKYEKESLRKESLPDFFAERDALLLNAYAGAGNPDGKRLGIPFTMLTYEFYPFWNAFFSELGFRVVLSEKSNKKIINDGLQSAVAETCFPMKAVLGHVIDLMNKGVDYLFLPSIRDMPCDHRNIEGTRTGSYPCPFVQGISTVVKASLKIDGAMILDPIINFSFREYVKEYQLQALGARLGKKKPQIRKAVEEAYRAQERFHSGVKKRGRDVLASLGDDEIAAVIVSRPYNSCDRSISMDIPRKIRDVGLPAIPLDYLPLDTVDVFEKWPNLYWEFGSRIMSALEIIRKDRRLYPVYITNFGCGPDSFILQYFERELNKPFLKIEVDEHTAGAGVITRCEAFADSLKNIQTVRVREADSCLERESPRTNRVPLFRKSDRRKVFFPYMGDAAYVARAAFRSAGIEAEVMHADDETLQLGRKYTLGKECYPFILTTGDMLKTLKYHDPKKTAFFMPLTYGPCRFGQYNKLQRIILRELGYEDVPILSPGAPESRNFYRAYDLDGPTGLRVYLTTVTGIFAVDYLGKMLRHTRPYESTNGQADAVYQRYLNRLCQCIESPGLRRVRRKMVEIVRSARVDFERIATVPGEKPVIGIVGEIYIRNHPYSNNEIVKKVEELGGEVEIPLYAEWFYHTNASTRLDITVKQKDARLRFVKSLSFHNNAGAEDLQKLLKNLSRGTVAFLANKMFRMYFDKYRHNLEKPLKGFWKEDGETDIYEIWDNAEPYIIKWFGEAALSVGKSVDWMRRGIDGVINVLPFTCMPGTLVTAASKRLKEDYGVPWLNIAYDGLEQATSEIRLEAFFYQAAQYKLRRSTPSHQRDSFPLVRSATL